MQDGGEVELETGFFCEAIRTLMETGHHVTFATGRMASTRRSCGTGRTASGTVRPRGARTDRPPAIKLPLTPPAGTLPRFGSPDASIMLRTFVLAIALLPILTAAQAAPPTDAPQPMTDSAPSAPRVPEPVATPPAATDAAPAAPAAEAPAPPAASAEQQHFEQFRHDLINLLALRAEPDLLVAGAELAFPDSGDKHRPPALKSPALIRRAQKFGAGDALVWWVATFIGCTPDAPNCQGEAVAKLQQLAPDNAAVWLPSLHAAKDPGQARALLASMAQAQRFDDYWSASVLAVFRALQTLPVPADVLSHGLNATAARINLATSVGGGFLPNYARLGDMCRRSETPDEALTVDCLAVAKLLESGGTFRSQAVGFGIEDSLLPAGTARDVLRARQRAAAWQKQQFLELSARFPRDETLAQTYVDLLRENGDELQTVTALLRGQHVPTDPAPGWQPQETDPLAAPRDPLAPPPAH